MLRRGTAPGVPQTAGGTKGRGARWATPGFVGAERPHWNRHRIRFIIYRRWAALHCTTSMGVRAGVEGRSSCPAAAGSGRLECGFSFKGLTGSLTVLFTACCGLAYRLPQQVDERSIDLPWSKRIGWPPCTTCGLSRGERLFGPVVRANGEVSSLDLRGRRQGGNRARQSAVASCTHVRSSCPCPARRGRSIRDHRPGGGLRSGRGGRSRG